MHHIHKINSWILSILLKTGPADCPAHTGQSTARKKGCAPHPFSYSSIPSLAAS